MGRKRNFIESEALFKALKVFWAKGFAATSIQDLVDSTGLQKPSLYNTFGDKEALFKKCLEMYKGKVLERVQAHPSGTEQIKAFFLQIMYEVENNALPNGCMIMNTAIEFGRTPGAISDLAKESWLLIENSFKNSIKIAIRNGDLIPGRYASKLSKWLITQVFTIRGLSRSTNDISYSKEVYKNVLAKIDEYKTVDKL